MLTIWHFIPARSEALTDLQGALTQLAMIAGSGSSGIDEADLVSKINSYARTLYVHVYKNKAYGNSWRSDLGYRTLIPWMKSKFDRLVNVSWHGVDLKEDPAAARKAVETLHDLINYAFFMIRMIEIECGVDYSSIRSECIENDYPLLNLEGVDLELWHLENKQESEG